MIVLIITPFKKSRLSNLLHERLRRKGINSHLIQLSDIIISLTENEWNFEQFFTDLYGGDPPDGIICRGIGTKKTKKIFFRVDIYRALESLGIPIINPPECLEMATNKMLSSLILKKNGIPTPETIACENYKSAVDAFERLGEDVVVKPMYGSKGWGLTRLQDKGFAEYFFYTLARTDEIFYVQKFYEHGNKDIRAFVVGDKVIAAMERQNDQWCTNIAKGGTGKSIMLEPEAKMMAVKSSRLVKGEITGVDLIRTSDGYAVLEINAIPGISGIQKTTDADLVDIMTDYYIEQFRTLG